MDLVNLFSVYDERSERYGVPFSAPNDAVAEREFATLVKDPNTAFGQWPEDYALWRVGTFDRKTGTLVPEGQGHLVVKGKMLTTTGD